MSNCVCGCATGFAIKQGDAYRLEVQLKFNGEPITEDELPLIEEIEFTFDDLEPQSYDPASIYNATLGKFLVPMSQEQSFWMGHGTTTLDCRVQFRGGDVVGVKSKSRIRVREANSYEVI